MAKTSAVEKNRKRIRMVEKFSSKRARLKAIATDQSIPAEERFAARLKLAELPRNSAPTRLIPLIPPGAEPRSEIIGSIPSKRLVQRPTTIPVQTRVIVISNAGFQMTCNCFNMNSIKYFSRIYI